MKRKLFVCAGLVLFSLTIGFVGGMDTMRIGVPAGVACAVLCETGSALLLWKAGVLG